MKSGLEMYEHLYEQLPDEGLYLKRLGRCAGLSPTRENLDGLVMAHLCRVPFENLDIFDFDLDINIGIRDLFDKIVVRGRGGYCFELNTLFAALLRALGYEANIVSARVLWGGKTGRPPVSHCAVVVSIDGRRFFCDVGFGGPAPAFALPLDSSAPPDAAEAAFFFRTDHEGTKILCRAVRGGAEPIISFSDVPADPVDFIAINYFYSKYPASFFRSKRMVNLKTEDGSVSVDGDILRRRGAQGLSETVLTGERELLSALKSEFGLGLSGPLRLGAASL